MLREATAGRPNLVCFIYKEPRFDHRIERDAKAGRLDQLAEQALADFRAGRAREL